jgi:hypothetical protein
MTEESNALTIPQQPSMLELIGQLARDPNVNPANLREILSIQRELEADQAKREYADAFSRLQPQLPRIKRDGTIDIPAKPGKRASKSHYAKLETIDLAIRPLLAQEGFSLSYDSAPRPGDGGGLIVTAKLHHRAGHFETASIPVPLDTSGSKNNIQGYGSTLSYGRRYALCALLNIITEGEDDDGVRGGQEYISEEQFVELLGLMREVQIDEQTFCERWFNVTGAADLERAAFVPAKNMLLSRKAQRAEKAS